MLCTQMWRYILSVTHLKADIRRINAGDFLCILLTEKQTMYSTTENSHLT